MAEEAVEEAVARPLTLAEVHESLDVPGFRVEIVQGRIIMSPTPAKRHSRIITWLTDQFQEVCDEHEWDRVTDVTVELPAAEERFVPDLLICPIDETTDGAWLVPSSEALLVAEVVSPSSETDDYGTKLETYSLNEIPIYLVVDPATAQVSVFSEPSEEGYRRSATIPVGEKLEIPAPVECTLDTTGMPVKRRSM